MPGTGSFQSANVRIGICLPGFVARLRFLRCDAVVRTDSSNRSMVAGLAACTSSRTAGASVRCLCRSIAWMRPGRTALRRLLQIRSADSHKTVIASRTASPEIRRPMTGSVGVSDSVGAMNVSNRIACLRWHSASATYWSRMRDFSSLVAV